MVRGVASLEEIVAFLEEPERDKTRLVKNVSSLHLAFGEKRELVALFLASEANAVNPIGHKGLTTARDR